MSIRILGVDIGTTTIKSSVVNGEGHSMSFCQEKMELLYPQPGHVEIDPNKLWSLFIKVLKKALLDSKTDASQVSCLAICVLRNTFITWDKVTGKPLHNFITWKDLRSVKLDEHYNNKLAVKMVKSGARVLYRITKKERFLIMKTLKFIPQLVVMRLVWVMRNIPEVSACIRSGSLLFGTLDTWLVWRLTNGQQHVTEISCACCTGLFDTMAFRWSKPLLKYLNIPATILPRVVESSYSFGCCDPEIFGAPIKIGAILGDQSSAVFGSGCWSPGDMKVTLGTGTFVSITTGDKMISSMEGAFPSVGWSIKGTPTYLLESMCNNTSATILWGKAIGLFPHERYSSDLAFNAGSSDQVRFIPSFNGFQAPHNDPDAAAGFIGIKLTTTKDNLVRALLESIIFRTKQLIDMALSEYNSKIKPLNLVKVSVNGGVSNNDFVVQGLANLNNVKVERSPSCEVSLLGVSLFAAYVQGYWTLEKIKLMVVPGTCFLPNDQLGLGDEFASWSQAVDRFLHWYPGA